VYNSLKNGSPTRFSVGKNFGSELHLLQISDSHTLEHKSKEINKKLIKNK
jgi:hypothetical protein